MNSAIDASLDARLQHRLGQIDAAYRASMEAAVAHLRRSGAAVGARVAGDRAPDFALADPDGRPVALSRLLDLGPVVLSFFRGEWCSFCRLEMDALIEARPELVARGASLVMVSPQGPTEALLERSAGLEGLAVLADPLNGVGLQYGLVFRMPDVLRQALLAVGVDLSRVYGTDAWLLPIPATYVIGTDGLIALAHTDPDFTKRLDPGAVLAALDGLTRRRTVAPPASGPRRSQAAESGRDLA
jgi:peroxiredoxin